MRVTLYQPTGGFFERLHPVTKLIWLILAFAPPFFSGKPLELLPYFVILLITALFAKAGANLLRIFKLMGLLFIMTTVLWGLFQKGQTVLLTIGPITLSQQGLEWGAAMGIRISCFVVAAVFFLTCTPIEDFTYGLSKLGLPFVAGFTLTLAFRLTPLFMESGQTIAMSQKARGLDLDSGNIIRRICVHVPIIIPILVCALRRADQLSVALESRGFGHSIKRTVLSEYIITWKDVVMISGTLVIGALMAVFVYRPF